ncbi:cytochrome c oxidase accessory protein CcoG [bacterium]|nr:cytochrome c oxidase accessory protein CcoG [bacterium]MBU1984400.1 cytochrome c oxidase accessory protein CcoG [bacterium]
MTNTVETPETQSPAASATVGEGGRRKWVYADLPHGRFDRARNIVYSLLLLFYLGAPWLNVNGQPFLRFDLPARRFSIFGTTFVATDLYLLALLLLISAVAMFFFSALLGRLWCGWACPQTVFLEGIFRRLERRIEGSPMKRRKLDDGPKNAEYWTNKMSKSAVFLIVSAILSLGFVAFFIGPRGMIEMLSGDVAHPAGLVTTILLTGLTYWNFAWFREQFCTFLCPYARFQAVMLDDHSLIVGYDPRRGEPRGMFRPGQSWESRGDCIDCKRCVQVCPTGIDIRNGLQLECVSCTACIDACDAVMDRISRPRGLVRYDSLTGLAGRKRRVVRQRVVVYAVIMILLLVIFTTRVMSRDRVELTVARAAGVPYLVQEDGRVRNLFTLHVTNSEAFEQTITIDVDGHPDIELIVPGQPFAVPPGGRISTEAFVLLPKDKINASETPVVFRLLNGDSVLTRTKTVFLGPLRRSTQ